MDTKDVVHIYNGYYSAIKMNKFQLQSTQSEFRKRKINIVSHQFMANRRGNSDKTLLMGTKITADADSSHEIKRRLLLGRKVMITLDSILKTKTLLCQQRSI